jgi:peptidoglycan LD-endopeptidase CwlK
MFVYGSASKARVADLDPRFQKVCNRAIQLSEIDFTIVEGRRSEEQCYINFGRGRTKAQCIAGGCPPEYSRPKDNKVTWLRKALSSNHYAPKGQGKAVDAYPYPVSLVLGKKLGKTELDMFDKIAKAFFAASKELNIPIRWGADWDLDNIPRERGEVDNPHFELRS